MVRITVHHHLVSTFGDALSSALEYSDSITFLHSERVVGLAEELGKQLGLKHQQLENLWIAAFFHDVGKVGIPDGVLNKPGKLSESEWALMKTHSAISAEIVRKIDSKRATNLARIVRHHHEFMNGKGYPDGLKGEEIPYLSRIIAVVDCYDAMTTDREYRSGMSHAVAIGNMKDEVWKKYDPEIASVFFQLIETSKHKAH